MNYQRNRSTENETNLNQNGKIAIQLTCDSFVFLKKYYVVYLFMIAMLVKIILTVKVCILSFRYDTFGYSSINFMFPLTDVPFILFKSCSYMFGCM